MKNNLQKLFEKITSRKFITAMIGVIIGIATAAGVDPSEYADTAAQIAALIAQIAGLVSALVSGVVYIRAETAIDVERISASREINVGFPESYADPMKDALLGDTEKKDEQRDQ